MCVCVCRKLLKSKNDLSKSFWKFPVDEFWCKKFYNRLKIVDLARGVNMTPPPANRLDLDVPANRVNSHSMVQS